MNHFVICIVFVLFSLVIQTPAQTEPQPSVSPVAPFVEPQPSVSPVAPSVEPDLTPQPSVSPVAPSVEPQPSVSPVAPSVEPQPSVSPVIPPVEPQPEPNLTPEPSASPVSPPVDSETTRIVNLVLNIAVMVVGAVWVVFGYRLFRIALFVAGFIVFYYVCIEVLHVYAAQSLAEWAMYVISAIVGLIGGTLFVVLSVVGFFLFGMLFGTLFALMLFASTPLGNIQFDHTWYQLLIILGFGIITGILAVFFSRYLIILGTSFNGSFLIFHVIDSMWVHTSLSALLKNIFQNISDPVIHQSVKTNDWRAYVLLAAIVLLTAFGVFIQIRLTAPKNREKGKGNTEMDALLHSTDV